MFAPVCSILDVPIPPCKHLCLAAKSGCEEIILKFGFKWPDILDCNRLEKVNGMCVGENRTQSTDHNPTSSEILNKLPTVIIPKQELECPHTMKVLSKTR